MLVVLWRARRWRFLLNLIDHLPRHSYFVEALLDDDEFGRQMLNAPDVAYRERVSEWSPDREGLARIEDAIRGVQVGLAAMMGAAPPKIEPAVRPITAADRARAEHRREKRQSLMSKLFPDS